MEITPADSSNATATNSFIVDFEDGDNSGRSKTVAEIYFTAIRVLVGTVGVLGNLTVCIVATKLKSNEVKFLIISQAFIDFLTSCVLVSGTVSGRCFYPQLVSPKSYTLGIMYCMLWHWEGLLFILFSISTWNLVAISIERYMAILHPIWYRTSFTRKKAIMLGASLWSIAPTLQIVYMASQTSYLKDKCIFVYIAQPFLGILGVFLFLWDYFIPCFIMGYCFKRISVALKEQDAKALTLKADLELSLVSGKLNGPATADKKAAIARSRNVTKTFLIVFIAFILCWITNQIMFLQVNLGGYAYHDTPVNHFANTMAILNSACNPFIYVLRFKQYRDKIMAVFCCRRWKLGFWIWAPD